MSRNQKQRIDRLEYLVAVLVNELARERGESNGSAVVAKHFDNMIAKEQACQHRHGMLAMRGASFSPMGKTTDEAPGVALTLKALRA